MTPTLPLGQSSRAPEPSRERLWLRVGSMAPVELLYVEESEVYFVLPTGPSQAWAGAVLRQGVGEVEAPLRPPRLCHASLLVVPERARAVRYAFRRKYGEETWNRHLERAMKVLVLDPHRAASGARNELELVQEEFEAIAPRYTAVNLADPMERRLKRRSTERLCRLFLARDPLLEVGCGTGLETLPLLLEGHRIVAVDLAQNMLEQLLERARAAGVVERVETRVGRLGRLHTALRDLPAGHFQGAFSTFGAMNLENDLSTVPSELHRLLAPGAPLFLAVLNPLGVAPFLYVTAAGRPREAAARWSSTVPAGRIQYPLEVHPRRPVTLAKAFARYFTLERVEAASVLAPPWTSARLLSLLSPSAKGRLDRLDDRLGRLWPFNQLGEWAFLTLRRAGIPQASGARETIP